MAGQAEQVVCEGRWGRFRRSGGAGHDGDPCLLAVVGVAPAARASCLWKNVTIDGVSNSAGPTFRATARPTRSTSRVVGSPYAPSSLAAWGMESQSRPKRLHPASRP